MMGFIDTLKLASGQRIWTPMCRCGHEDFYHYAGHGRCKCEAAYRHCATCSCASLPVSGLCLCKRYVFGREELSIWAKVPLMEELERMLRSRPRPDPMALSRDLGLPLEHVVKLQDALKKEAG
jgi:hypothetical protein